MNFYINARVYGNNILYTGIENSKKIRAKIPYRPKLYIPSKTTSPYQTIYGDYLQELEPGDIKETRDFIRQYENVENFKIYGNTKFEYCYISDQFPNDIEYDIGNIRIAIVDIEVNSDPETGGFSSPENPFQPITAITLKFLNEPKYHVFSCGHFDAPDNVIYYNCNSEEHLASKFIQIWSENHPDIVSGWMSSNFDINYIVNRFNRILDSSEVNKLSPWHIVKQTNRKEFNEKFSRYEETLKTEIFGISQLDYLELYKKHFPGGNSRESHKLDFICELEINEKKVEYDGSLHKLYTEDFDKFIRYNIKDVELVENLDKKCKLFELALMLAYISKSNYEDVFKQTRMWDSLIYGFLKQKGIQVPQTEHDNDGSYEGAFVKDPILGMHRWVVSLDATSLYPSIIMGKNISPETLVTSYNSDLNKIKSQNANVNSLLNKTVDLSALKDNNVGIAANGHFFKNDKKGFLPEIVEKYFNQRVIFKKEKLRLEAECEKLKKSKTNKAKVEELKYQIAKFDTMQWAIKIFLNSLYGSIANKYFRFFDLRLAEAITLEGQLSIQWAEKYLNQYLNNLLKTDKDYVIACDTDSLLFYLSDLVNKFYPPEAQQDKSKIIEFLIKVIDKKIQPYVNFICEDLCSYVNSYENKINFKVEKICSAGIWTAKKRYALSVYSNEGVIYSEPKTKVTGLEVIKSSTPKVIRDKIKKCIEIMLNSTEPELIDYIATVDKEFKSFPVEMIAFPRGVNGVSKYYDSTTLYKKGTPLHVRGALLHNKFVKDNKLSQYELIKDGDKIKYCYLKMPNKLKENVIAFVDKLPVEFDLTTYVDYDIMFEKVFKEPVKTLSNVIGWKIEKSFNIEDFI
jgi:DNA polymerase elongation subunit (family B)